MVFGDSRFFFIVGDSLCMICEVRFESWDFIRRFRVFIDFFRFVCSFCVVGWFRECVGL